MKNKQLDRKGHEVSLTSLVAAYIHVVNTECLFIIGGKLCK